VKNGSVGVGGMIEKSVKLSGNNINMAGQSA
jgi:hypothetical protein